MCVTVVWLK